MYVCLTSVNYFAMNRHKRPRQNMTNIDNLDGRSQPFVLRVSFSLSEEGFGWRRCFARKNDRGFWHSVVGSDKFLGKVNQMAPIQKEAKCTGAWALVCNGFSICGVLVAEVRAYAGEVPSQDFDTSWTPVSSFIRSMLVWELFWLTWALLHVRVTWSDYLQNLKP